MKKIKANTIITGGRLNGPTDENQHADGQPRRCLEESATLLHGGLDTSRQVTSKSNLRLKLKNAAVEHLKKSV